MSDPFDAGPAAQAHAAKNGQVAADTMRHPFLTGAAIAGIVALGLAPRYLRRPLVLAGVSFLAGCFLGEGLPRTDVGTYNADGSYNNDFDIRMFTGVPTVWSWLLWIVSIFALVSFFRRLVRLRRYNRQRAAERYELEAMDGYDALNAAAEPQEVRVVPTPTTPVKSPERATQPVSEDPEGTSTTHLWLPSDHVPNRRVRRGGETLSGTPIKDRRTVDPRNL